MVGGRLKEMTLGYAKITRAENVVSLPALSTTLTREVRVMSRRLLYIQHRVHAIRVPVFTEVWRDSPDWIGYYQVSQNGLVRSLRRMVVDSRGGQRIIRGRILKSWLDRYGYLWVDLSRDGESNHRLIHQMVLEAFVGKCPDEMECRHYDGNSTNNRLENLSWGTHEQNEGDKKRHGTVPRGERNGNYTHPERRPKGEQNGTRQTHSRSSFGGPKDTCQ